MKPQSTLDYESYYDSIFKLDKNSPEVKATQFLNFLSDLVLKYKNNIESKCGNNEGENL